MNPVCSFLVKFARVISWALSCFDRVLCKGHLPIRRPYEIENFVDYVLTMRRADFMKTVAPHWSDRLVKYAQGFAQKAGRLYEYHQGEIDKDAWAKGQIAAHQLHEGLVGVLCVKENCATFKLGYAEGRPRLVRKKVPVRVLYYHFLDRDLGLMHVRLQTWAPFTRQVYVNGHDFVARKLKHQGLGFEQIDNAFVQLDDPRQAQRIADRFAKLPWPKILEAYARRVNPLLKKELKGMSHYWVIDQAEFATDVLFVSKNALAGLFLRLLEFAVLTFSPKKVFHYLGRKYHEKFDGEVLAGDRIAQGFRNNDIRTALYGTDAKDRHRQSAAMGRLLKRLHVRGLVVKVPRTRRWRVTENGRRILGDTLRTYRRYSPQAA